MTRQKPGYPGARCLGRGARTATFLLGLLGACKASVKGDVHTGVDESPPAPPPSDPAPLAPPLPATSASSAPPETSFIGVTHALTLSPKASAAERCSCLAVAVGAPSDPAFVWQGKAPTVGPEAVVFAVAPAPCKPGQSEGKPHRGPSIQGIDREGDNVVVSLEEPRSGVPVARGAIVLRPPPGGGFLVRASPKLTYGKSLSGKDGDACLIR